MFQQALVAAAAAPAFVAGNANAQVDEEAAKALAKQNKCMNFHTQVHGSNHPSPTNPTPQFPPSHGATS